MTLPVIVAGGGIGGLSVALTLQQLGVPCLVLEAAPELLPLGVGINLQPNAVRELYDLGFGPAELDRIGIETREFALVGLNGNDIYSEPRGKGAGYLWPQYSVHRGRLQMMLYQAALARLGAGAVRTGMKVTGYRNHDTGVTVEAQDLTGGRHSFEASLLIAADGLHSAVRQQMHPSQPPIHWGGAIMWRGVTRGAPIRTGASFVGLGTLRHRVVFYPISQPDPATGLADINWIAEITVDNSAGWRSGDWNRRVAHEEFVHHFERWNYDWIDIPGMLRGAADVYEYPMIDRDPVSTWRDGRVALMGDAAHVMYPTGSNGASQAIVDARVLGAVLLEHGVSQQALQAFDARLCPEISPLILRNRGAGPFGILGIVEERCGGVFDRIDDVIPRAEREEFMERYRLAAGFAVARLNAAPPIIPAGARIA
ncbi:MAG TPA: flavin-dependent oxidoreductase [Steroidobacteraceae bacterium]|nr:flavin-dependent oxidoreductase [Steroidobacteraceae bacterium]